MKCITQIDIDRPLEAVISKFDNPANLPFWMEGLKSMKLISGTLGQPGAKSRMNFQTGKRQFDLTETILTRHLPQEFTCQYESSHVVNIVKHRFVSVSPARTRYITENDLHFSGWLKILGWVMPGAFRRQSYKYQVAFKNFVERNG